MLINLALSSICAGVQTFVAFILDEKPEWTKHRLRIVIGSCIFYFLLGLPMCCGGGIHLFKVFDSRCSSSLLLLSFIEIILVAYVYGAEKFLSNIAEMKMKLSRVTTLYWKVMWYLVSPIIMAAVIVLRWVNTEPMKWDSPGGETYEYPAAIQAVGWILELSPTVITLLYPLWVVHRYKQKGYHGEQLLRRILQPSDSWEKTNGMAVPQAKINEAFYDESVYKVSPSGSLKKKYSGEEKLTEL